jgi:hypothetical protein
VDAEGWTLVNLDVFVDRLGSSFSRVVWPTFALIKHSTHVPKRISTDKLESWE